MKENPVGNAPIGEMPDAVRLALGAQTRTVRLSGETMEKQLHKHGDLTDDDYAHLPDALARPDIVARQGERRVLFFHHAGQLYRGALKTTGDGPANYLLSFHRTTKEKAAKALRGTQVLPGDLAALPDDESAAVDDE